ncbi:terminase small subunit [Stenotrophomonas phage Stm18]
MAANSATEGSLGSLHNVLAEVLINALRNPDQCTAAVMNAARGFLKDNDITCRIEDGSKLGELEDELNKQGPGSTPVEDKTLQDALDDVIDMERYRGRAG